MSSLSTVMVMGDAPFITVTEKLNRASRLMEVKLERN